MKDVFKQNMNDDSDGAHLALFGIGFQTEKVKENEPSQNVALLYADLLRRCMMCQLERMLRVHDGFFGSISATYDGAVLLWQW